MQFIQPNGNVYYHSKNALNIIKLAKHLGEFQRNVVRTAKVIQNENCFPITPNLICKQELQILVKELEMISNEYTKGIWTRKSNFTRKPLT